MFIFKQTKKKHTWLGAILTFVLMSTIKLIVFIVRKSMKPRQGLAKAKSNVVEGEVVK